MKLPMLVLVYQPTLFASTLTSRRNLIISLLYATFCLARGAAAARLAADSFEASLCAIETSGKGNELVISSTPSFSMPTRLPVAVAGNDFPLAVASLMATWGLRSVSAKSTNGGAPRGGVLAAGGHVRGHRSAPP